MRSSGTPRDSPPGWQEFASATPPRAGEAVARWGRARPDSAPACGPCGGGSAPVPSRCEGTQFCSCRRPGLLGKNALAALCPSLRTGGDIVARTVAGGRRLQFACSPRTQGRTTVLRNAGGERAGGEWRPRPRTSTCRVNPRGPQRERAARRRADAAPRLWCVSKPRVCSPPGSLTRRVCHRPPADSGSLPLWGLQPRPRPRPHGPPPQTAGPSPRAVWGAKGSCVLDKGCAECPLRAGGATRLPRRGQRARHTAALTADPAGRQMPLHPTAPAGGGSRPWQ